MYSKALKWDFLHLKCQVPKNHFVRVYQPSLWEGNIKGGSSSELDSSFQTGTLYHEFPSGLAVKNPPANVGDVGLMPGWGRSTGEGNADPLQYACLGNFMDRGSCQPYRVKKSWTRLRGWTQTWPSRLWPFWNTCPDSSAVPNIQKQYRGFTMCLSSIQLGEWKESSR